MNERRKGFDFRPRLASYEDTAIILGIGVTKTRELADAGELETIQIGRGKRVVIASIDAYIERQSNSKTTPAKNAGDSK